MDQKCHIIIPVHNRREVTLANLRLLQGQNLFSRFSVIVVDDGSTDGTSAAITAEFPQVVILKGSGALYWTGAMELGMRHAVAAGTNCCIWLNDDLTLDTGAIDTVVSLAMERGAIVSGQGIVDHGVGEPWLHPLLYRGFHGLESQEIACDTTTPQQSDTCRGNLVAIATNVIEKIGYPDGTNIPHVAGDTDYGLRASFAGFEVLTLPTARFYEKEAIRDDNRSWLLGTRPLRKIWKESLSKRGNLYPRMAFTYYTRHWGSVGFLMALELFIKLIAMSLLRIAVPRPLLHRLYAHKSHAHRVYEELDTNRLNAENTTGATPPNIPHE